MELFKYRDYNHYRRSQIDANKRKYDWVWVHKKSIQDLKENITAKKILCHGVRNGAELKYFNEVFSPDHIVGTDISPTVNIIKDEFEVYEIDFHEELKYKEYFDLVYSNCLDHSYDPKKALKVWSDQLVVGGHLVVEIMLGINNQSNETDPCEIDVDEYEELLDKINHKVKLKIKSWGPIGESMIVVSKKKEA